MKYIYPCLGNGDLGFVKLNGPGLANQMIVAARAFCMHRRYNIAMINPTWQKLSIGPYIRHENDKRHYFGLFNKYGIGGLRKLWAINHVTHSEGELQDFLNCDGDAVLKVEGLRNYFQDLDQPLCHDYFRQIASSRIRNSIALCDYSQKVAMHVRLGDYSLTQRSPIEWYVRVGEAIHQLNHSLEVLLFSDGQDEELDELLSKSYVKRAVGNNALRDILAISKCKIVVASHSTFSAMGAFIGNRPVVFPRRDFPPLYRDKKRELVIPHVDEDTLPQLSQIIQFP